MRLTGSRGFTLIEMVVTVAIVGLLAAMAVPLVELSMQRAKERELREALREIRSAIDAWHDAVRAGRIEARPDEAGYPPNLDVLVNGVVDRKDPRGRRIYFLRRLPRDPMDPERSGPATDTWAKRSYESPPDAPAEGKDVFDVLSRSEKVGLNGVPYKEW